MARKNRKKRTMDGFMFPAPFAGVVVVIATLALAYVWLCGRCETLGREIKALELRNFALGKMYMKEEYKWTRLKAPENLERILAELNIPMTWPRRDQVVRLYDSEALAELPMAPSENVLTYVRREGVVMND